MVTGQLADCQLADQSSRGLVNSRMMLLTKRTLHSVD